MVNIDEKTKTYCVICSFDNTLVIAQKCLVILVINLVIIVSFNFSFVLFSNFLGIIFYYRGKIKNKYGLKLKRYLEIY